MLKKILKNVNEDVAKETVRSLMVDTYNEILEEEVEYDYVLNDKMMGQELEKLFRRKGDEMTTSDLFSARLRFDSIRDDIIDDIVYKRDMSDNIKAINILLYEFGSDLRVVSIHHRKGSHSEPVLIYRLIYYPRAEHDQEYETEVKEFTAFDLWLTYLAPAVQRRGIIRPETAKIKYMDLTSSAREYIKKGGNEVSKYVDMINQWISQYTGINYISVENLEVIRVNLILTVTIRS